MTLDVDVVRWGDVVIPILHFYGYNGKLYGRVSFVPLEDVEPSIELQKHHRVERLLAASGAKSKDALLDGNHARLDVPREDVLNLLSKPTHLAPRRGKRKIASTLVSVRVFCNLVCKLDTGFDVVKTWWATRPGSSATDLMHAADHPAKPLLVAPPVVVRLGFGLGASWYRGGRCFGFFGGVPGATSPLACNRRVACWRDSKCAAPASLCSAGGAGTPCWGWGSFTS